jgi:hypothetical protein
MMDYPENMCPDCRAVLEAHNGEVEVENAISISYMAPELWRHSERELWHACIRVHDRYIFLCATDEYDEKTRKRLKPMKHGENYIWKFFKNGRLYQIVEYDHHYEILSDAGAIVKDEQIEAVVFNHMIHFREDTVFQA